MCNNIIYVIVRVHFSQSSSWWRN